MEPPELRDLWLLGAGFSADTRRGRLPLPHWGAQVDRVAPGGIAEVAEIAKKKGVLGLPTELRPRHVRTGRPLFERLPELGDIHQRQLGDCWFLAALAAIVHAGTGHAIELLMREVDEVGTDAFAYVRLWDQALQPHYVRVDTDLIEVEGPAVFHSVGGLWAAVLEKAMTAIDADGNYDPQGASYARLWSGKSTRAFRALLGVASEYRKLPAGAHAQSSTGAVSRMNEGGDLRQLYHVLLGDDDVPPHVPSAVFAGLVGHGEVPLFYQSVWKPWAARTSLGALWSNAYVVRASQGGVFRQEHFEPFMRAHAQQHASAWRDLLTGWTWTRPRPAQSLANPSPPRSEHLPGYGLEPHLAAQAGYGVWGGPFGGPTAQGPAAREPTADDAVAAVCGWAWRQGHFPRKRGTGLYTDAQVRLHDEIAQHLLAHRPVCLGTRKEVGRTKDSERGYSGEAMSKGLAGKHGYAVTGCHTDATGLRFVQVFNPWGNTGRGYTFTLTNPSLARLPTGAVIGEAAGRWLKGERQATAYETSEPVFWLELDDVAKRCDHLYTCGSSTPDLIVAGRKAAGLST